jgi:hypothetical protein
MTSHELNRAVARATGESVDTIIHRGFSPLVLEPEDDDLLDRPPLIVDWDALDALRLRSAA